MERERLLGTLDAVPLVAGAMLGIGIFLVPAEVASVFPNSYWVYGMWAFVGFVCWMGALSYAELGSAFPKAGGDYVYLKEIYGEATARVLGWVIFAGIFTGSIAALAVPLCTYQLPFLLSPYIDIEWDKAYGLLDLRQVVACFIIIALTVVNVVGLRLSTLFQSILTLLPIMVYILISSWSLLFTDPVVEAPIVSPATPISLAGIGIAFGAIYFAFSGWNQAMYVAGEIKRPKETLPRTVSISVLGIISVYLILNLTFVHNLGFNYLQQVGFVEVGTASAQRMGGDVWGWWMNILIMLGLIGSLNGTILCGARVVYAMAEQKGMPHYFRQYSNKFQPERALWLQALIACLFVITGTFTQLLEFVSIAMVAIGVLTVVGVWLIKYKDGSDRYHAPKFAPYIFVFGGGSMCIIMVYNTIADQNWLAIVGTVCVIIGLVTVKISEARTKIWPHKEHVG